MSSSTGFRVPVLVACAVLAAAACGPAGPARAQSVQGDPVDLEFAVVNATTGEPGTVERMTIEYVRNRRNGILDFEPSGSEFVAPGVPIKDVGQYIVAVWKDGVPYWWSKRGRELTAGVTTLHVFDTTSSLDGIAISGLNLVLRRQESLLNIELMLQIENTRSPQMTVFDGQATLRLNFPADAAHVAANYRRGPDPTEIPVSLAGRRLDLAVPLTPGNSQVQITASLPWREGMDIPVGAEVPIQAWSLLTSPEWLEVQAMELETGRTDVPGFSRHTGPALSAGRSYDLRLLSGEKPAGEAEDLFSNEVPTEATAPSTTAGSEDGGGLRLPFVFGGVLIIIVFIAAMRRRG